MSHTQCLDDLLDSGLVDFGALLDEETDGSVVALDGSRDLIDILGLNDGLEVVLKNLGEVVLQLRTTEVLQDLLPVRRVVVTAEVGLQLAAQNLQGSTLSSTVTTNETQDLTRSGHGQSVELETVGRVTVGDLRLEVGGQVDDVDGIERTFLGADTATDTETLRDEGNLGRAVDLNTELSGTDDGARFLALLTTFLCGRLERVSVDGRMKRLIVPWACTIWIVSKQISEQRERQTYLVAVDNGNTADARLEKRHARKFSQAAAAGANTYRVNLSDILGDCIASQKLTRNRETVSVKRGRQTASEDTWVTRSGQERRNNELRPSLPRNLIGWRGRLKRAYSVGASFNLKKSPTLSHLHHITHETKNTTRTVWTWSHMAGKLVFLFLSLSRYPARVSLVLAFLSSLEPIAYTIRYHESPVASIA